MLSARCPLLVATAALAVLSAAGTAWFALVEGFGVLDAAYMVVITITTVGFHEVEPLDTSGRLFTMVLSLAGIGMMLYVAITFVEEARAPPRRTARSRCRALPPSRTAPAPRRCGAGG